MSREIDYSALMVKFKEITDIKDDEVALRYLEDSNWNLDDATMCFLDKNHEEPHQHLRYIHNEPIHREPDPIPTENTGEGFSGFFSSINNFCKINLKVVKNPLDSFFNSGVLNQQNTNRVQQFPQYQIEEINSNINRDLPTNDLLKFLPYHSKSEEEFYRSIKSKIGILFLYNKRDTDNIMSLIEHLFADGEMIHILEENYVTYSVLDEAQPRHNLLQQNDFITPTVLFMYNPHNLNKYSSEIIIDKLQGHFHVDIFSNYIYRCLTLREDIKSTLATNDDSHSSLIEQQNEELRRLEKEIEDRKYKDKLEQEQKSRKEQEEKDKIMKQKEEEERIIKERLLKIKELPIEPIEGDKDSTNIIFRLPDGLNRVERRFSKKDKVADLYNFIHTLENFQSAKFDLIQPFPFILYQEKSNTLEQEKLFPNAVIQIREELDN